MYIKYDYKEKFMFKWDEKNIGWYASAAEKSNHHKIMVEALKKYLKEDDVVFDLGCGLGYLSMEISKIVKKVVAVDINGDALKHLEKECALRHIDNIEIVCDDWTKWTPKTKGDVVILSYCNGINHSFNKLESLTNRYIISILLTSNNGTNFNLNKHVDIPKLFKNRETAETVRPVLDTKHIKYDFEDITTEFGQPFNNLTEAREFIKHYFKLTDKDKIDEYIKQFIIDKESYYYLPNKKYSGITVIDTINDFH